MVHSPFTRCLHFGDVLSECRLFKLQIESVEKLLEYLVFIH